MQDRFKASVPAMMVPRTTSDYATLGTAARWLLRYLVYPAVDYSLARTGAEFAHSGRVDVMAAPDALHRREGR